MLHINPDGTVSDTKYSIAKLKRDHPNTSFPADIPVALLAEYNVFEIVPTAEPTHTNGEIAVQTGGVVKVGNEWQWEWVVRPKTTEELATEAANIVQNVNARIMSIKREANRRIIAIVPEWKQSNMLARAITLLRKGEANLTTAEALEVSKMDAVWTEIQRIRSVSDTLEAADPPPEDFADDRHWV
jgi:hypothetical protein